MKDLSQRQQELLNTIHKYWTEHGVPPTRLELAKRLGRAASTIEQHLQALAGKGCINMVPGLNRNIRLTNEILEQMQSSDISVHGLPLIGRVAAGSPILAQQNIEDYCRIDSELFKPHPNYLLRVYGDSMRDAGILNGDLLAVHSTSDIHNRQIVVARLDDEATVKRFERVNDQLVRLCPENPQYQPIEINLTQQPLVIEGLAVGVIRNGRL
jgi:repressor LexA